MISWRAQKQVTIVSVFAVALVVIGLFVFLKSYFVASCFDTIRNQGEEDVDCGGPCVPCAIARAKSPEVFWARGIETRSGVFDVAAWVENVNETLAAPEVEYEFVLFDGEQEMARRTGKTFLLPKERAYVIEPAMVATGSPTRVEFKITNIKEWRVWNEAHPNLIVEQRTYARKEENGLVQGVLEATLFNRSSFDFRAVEVRIAILDKNGNLVAANRIMIDNFLSGSRKTIKSIWPRVLAEDAVDRIEITARVNVFDPLAILRAPQ